VVKAALDDEVTTSGVLLKEFHPGTSDLVKRLSEKRFVEFSTEPAMVLPIDTAWASFDDYLASLSSKYRVKAKRAYAKSVDLEMRDLCVDDVRQYRDRLAALYKAVADRAEFKLGGLDTDTLFELCHHMADDFFLRGYFLKQGLVGFAMAFVNGDTLEAGLVGIDYSLNKERAIYQRMLYDYLRYALENRLARVNYGRTAGEIKSTLGAVPVAMSCLLRLERSPLSAVLPLFKGAVRPRTFAMRKPFKKNWYEESQARLLPKVNAGDMSAPIREAL
jgi:predicted N-acyltransferase